VGLVGKTGGHIGAFSHLEGNKNTGTKENESLGKKGSKRDTGGGKCRTIWKEKMERECPPRYRGN